MNSIVDVKVVLSRKQFFCDIHFKVMELVQSTETPVVGVTVVLYTLAGERITNCVTNSLGEGTIGDMPIRETYVWKTTHPDYDAKEGQVVT